MRELMDQEGSPAVNQIASGAARAPVPAWVELEPYGRPASPNPHFVSGGACALLDDTQVDLCGPQRAWFCRRADLVIAGVGAERVAQFEALYDPTYERIEIHFIRVLRGAETIDHTNSPMFEVMRRERNLEQLKFDGRLSVHLTIPDVRVGDVVEIAYTTYGMRPLLGDRHAAWIGFEWREGVIEVRHRLRRPETRAIAIRSVNDAPPPVTHAADGIVEQRWRVVERAALKGESLAPPWIVQRAELQFSEWRDWAEVAAVFAPGYLEDGPLPAEVEAELGRIASMQTPAQRAAAALRFVQNSIRYLALAIGDGGFAPRPLAEIWATRYGDCKDKAKLYCAMARRLGLDAVPALVNTREGMALKAWLPTGLAFDHCIIRLALDGHIYWLDPTSLPQPSVLDHIAQSRYGWALPLAADASALEFMGDEPHRHTLESTELVKVGNSPDVPVRYEWRVTMRGWRAEDLRHRFAREGAIGLFKMYAEDIQRTWHGAKPVRQEILNDDQALNEITTLEDFEIAEAWRKTPEGRYAFSTLDLYLRNTFAKLDPGPRKYPIYLGHVGRLIRRVEIETATSWDVASWSKSVEASSVSYRSELRQLSPKRMELTQMLDIRAWTLPAEEAQKYRDIVAMLDVSDLHMEKAVRRGRFVRSKKGQAALLYWTWLSIGIAALIALFAYSYIRQGLAP
ncbi:MAG TPA: DUF3857 domain-containing protein [Caulobacterales bacterium]|nr:DUF3857 domain-containing protein [Caulobacterales bacterium]